MAEIRWTEEAHRWLRNIHDYIAMDNPAAAQKVISGIYEKAQMLRCFPEVGHKHHTETEEKSGYCFTGTIESYIC